MKGVVRKIIDQVEAWNILGQEVLPIIAAEHSRGLRSIMKKNHYFIHLQSKRDKIFYLKKAYPELVKFKPDIVYSRHINIVPYLQKITRSFNYIIEVNSFLIPESKLALKRSVFFLPDFFWRILTRKFIYRKAAGFVSVSNELKEKDISIYKKPTIVIPNCINTKKIMPIKKSTSKSDSIIELFFLGSPGQSWHGVDKVLEFAEKTIGMTQIHIIGIDRPPGFLPSNIRYYGYCDFETYKDIVSSCHIAIGTLGLHRKKMKEASPLKVREYLALGYPTIIAYDDTAFLEKDFSFLLKLPNNENNVKDNINIIVDFIVKNKNVVVSKEEIIKSIDTCEIEVEKLKFFNNGNRYKYKA